MKNIIRMGLCLGLALLLCLSALAAPDSLIPGGNTIGLQMDTRGVSIVEVCSESGKGAGLKKGDLIIAVDGKPISSPEDLQRAASGSRGRALRFSLLRDGSEKSCSLAPQKTEKGWLWGITVRDGISGIGTVTYYNTRDNSFGALGHGVSEGAGLLPMEQGHVLPSEVAAVVKGKKGEPGALQGALAGRSPLGTIRENTPSGIFGTMPCPRKDPLPVGPWQEVEKGEAKILSNVQGTDVKEYTVEILEIRPKDSQNRNLLIKVTDPELLKQTGGIVQGMSGSPIIQDGKLVGAVTHVLLEDPTRGYGIFIENMLDAAA